MLTPRHKTGFTHAHIKYQRFCFSFTLNGVIVFITKLNSGSVALLKYTSIACGGKLGTVKLFQAAEEAPTNQIAWLINNLVPWLIVATVPGIKPVGHKVLKPFACLTVYTNGSLTVVFLLNYRGYYWKDGGLISQEWLKRKWYRKWKMHTQMQLHNLNFSFTFQMFFFLCFGYNSKRDTVPLWGLIGLTCFCRDRLHEPCFSKSTPDVAGPQVTKTCEVHNGQNDSKALRAPGINVFMADTSTPRSKHSTNIMCSCSHNPLEVTYSLNIINVNGQICLHEQIPHGNTSWGVRRSFISVKAILNVKLW